MTLEQQLKSGMSQQQAGRLKEAERIYREALAQEPNNPDALHLLGVVLGHMGQLDAALELIRRAIRFLPDYAEACNSLGNVFMQKRELEEALKAYREAIRIRTDFSEAHNNLGLSLKDLGRLEEAVVAFSDASRQKPDWTTPQLNLGQLFREQGRAEEALSAFGRAMQIDPQNADTVSFVATALADLHRFDEALSTLDRAAAMEPNSALTHAARGMILSRQGQGMRAVESFRRAVEIAPELISAWINLGYALRQIGQFKEAAECCRQVLLRQPRAVQAYALMASVGGTTEPGELTQLSTLVDDPKISLRDRSKLEYALGKMLDKADRFDEAFAHFARANSLVLQMRQAVGARYSSAEFARQVDGAIAMFTPKFFEQTRDWGESSELPVFIVGMPRSGTSLVEQIASSHPEVFGAGELRDVGNIAVALSSTKGDPGPIKAAASKQLSRLRELGGATKRVIDKMPSNVERLGDPRDTCLSCFFQEFIAGNLYSLHLRDCGLHHVHMDRLIEHWLKVLPLRMLVVQYEQLVSDLEGQSRRIIGFLDLPWDPKCLDFHRTERTVQTISSWQVRQPIYSRSVGRWRHYRRHLGPLFDALRLPGDAP
jgi:tetratricopeptide (TPR) repeat protein